MNFNSYISSAAQTALTVNVNSISIKSPQFNLKKAAFTLAETLITLTIIGVIAALTIPTLVSKYQKHTYVVGLKKAYSQLQNAMKMIPITQGCPAGDYECAGWESSIDNQTYLLSKHFKHSKLCYENSTDADCKKIINSISVNTNALRASLGFFISDDNMFWTSYYTNEQIVDINGITGPNKLGRDQFVFDISSLGIVIPYGSMLHAGNNSDSPQYWRKYNSCSTKNVDTASSSWDFVHGASCTGRVLEEDAMNY